MSAGPLARLADLWRGRRRKREEAALSWLKARYHIFRVLLANNELALQGLAEIDRLLLDNEPARLGGAVLDLREAVLEIVDGLNRLTRNGHVGLYPRLAALGGELDAALEGYANAPRRAWVELSEVRPDMREQAGGKAQPLGALLRAGFPVPPGLCITRRSCRAYLRQARLEDRLKALLRQAARLAREAGEGQGAELERISAKARAMILASLPGPDFARELDLAWEKLSRGGHAVSVRSSASSEDGVEHSFAGQYESVLGVRTRQGFHEAFRQVLASAFSARAMSYRLAAGLGGESVDMAVLCQRMVDARTSGVLFTLDPTTRQTQAGPRQGRMLVTAVPGLGTLAVDGRAPADVYRPLRDARSESAGDIPADIAVKTLREDVGPDGGLARRDIPPGEGAAPLLSAAELEELRGHALRIEALAGRPQDIEWSVDQGGALWILQARPARVALPGSVGQDADAGGPALLSGGVAASPGKAAGRLVAVRSRQDVERAAREPRPVVLALRQSLVDAAALVPGAAALLVDLGNPLDHLAALARELGIPMITGLGTATNLEQGAWVLADADQGEVRPADPSLWKDAPRPAPPAPSQVSGAAGRVRELCLPLNLTDAYGPTFSVLECRSLHDLVRYAHEKAVMALFDAGDAIAEDSFSLVRRLRDPAGLIFLIIDLGGGLAPTGSSTIAPSDIRSEPLAALCRGMSTPGLRWGVAPPALGGGLSGLVSRGLLDGRSERPVGNPNFALVSRDYLNLNARVDFHFALVDAVCGPNPRENSVRFRFKGGGTARTQRERRAVFVEEVLRREEFFTSRQGDMVTGSFTEGPREVILAKLEMLGRFLGFSRLLDAVMVDDDMPGRVARAFLEGDYALKFLENEAGPQP